MIKSKAGIQSKTNSSEGLISKANISFYPVEDIDTSWMTKAQKRFFNVLKNTTNRQKNYTEILELAGYSITSHQSWHKAIKDKQFATLLESIGVNVRQRKFRNPPHYEIKYIKNPKERNEYLKQDIWDMRKLFKEYPKHRSPSVYIIDFTRIENTHLKTLVKRYFYNMFGEWEPGTFSFQLHKITRFVNILNNEFPEIKSFNELRRKTHIESILPHFHSLSKNLSNRIFHATKQMLNYMYLNNWVEGPITNNLLISYDSPNRIEPLPKPIPPYVKIQLDDYLENKIIPLLEADKDTPIVAAKYWDFIIIIRHTGRRFEDLAHMIADESDVDCLRYDLDGDPQLYIDHRIAKIAKDLVIPLVHIVDSHGKNIVEQAIIRQKKRVKKYPPTSDNQKYLFREVIAYDKDNTPITETISYNFVMNHVLPRICKLIPLSNIAQDSGSTYNITSHQFRHTVATEMIDAGVDIYAVKNFLGHSSVVMTEKYIKVYQQRLKKEFKDKLLKSDATVIKDNLPEQEEIFGDNKWVKNKIIAIFDQGDGCCEHPYKMPSCPHQVACKTCIKKKILPRHKNAVIDTINAFTTHLNQAKQIGLNEKLEEFDKVVQFYQAALEIIEKGETFDAAKHFYTGGFH